MNLIDQIVAVFKEALTAVFKREAEEKNYMKQSIFGCRWRAFWGITVAFIKSIKAMRNILAMAIAKHRTLKHGDDKTRTIRSLTRSMSDEQIKASEGTNSWWDA
jgi:hypothetical protein